MFVHRFLNQTSIDDKFTNLKVFFTFKNPIAKICWITSTGGKLLFERPAIPEFQ